MLTACTSRQLLMPWEPDSAPCARKSNPIDDVSAQVSLAHSVMVAAGLFRRPGSSTPPLRRTESDPRAPVVQLPVGTREPVTPMRQTGSGHGTRCQPRAAVRTRRRPSVRDASADHLFRESIPTTGRRHCLGAGGAHSSSGKGEPSGTLGKRRGTSQLPPAYCAGDCPGPHSASQAFVAVTPYEWWRLPAAARS
jgi:hypothetical protein